MVISSRSCLEKKRLSCQAVITMTLASTASGAIRPLLLKWDSLGRPLGCGYLPRLLTRGLQHLLFSALFMDLEAGERLDS